MQLLDILNKLEKASYRASKKTGILPETTKWLGHDIDENGVKPYEEKLEAILKLKLPHNTRN